MKKYNPQELFESMEQVATYVNINTDFPMSSFLPYIRSAINTIVAPITGHTFLNDHLSDPDNLEGFRTVVAPLAIMLATHEQSIQFGEAGHNVSKNEQAGLLPASDKKVEAYRDACARRGYSELDTWLHDHYQFPSGNFMRSPNDLNKLLGLRLNHPCLIYDMLTPAFADIAQWELNTILTGDQYDSLFDGSAVDYDRWKKLLLIIQKYVVKKGFLKVFGSGDIQHDGTGYTPLFTRFDPEAMREDANILKEQLITEVNRLDPEGATGYDPEFNHHKRTFSCIP